MSSGSDERKAMSEPPAETYLPSGLPAPQPARDGLDRPFWEGAARGELLVQRCGGCGTFRFPPEWICHACRSTAVEWVRVEPSGRVYSWSRVWRAFHPALGPAVPYRIVLVELPQAGGVRMVGNLLGEASEEVAIGDPVEAVFEPHDGFALVQWRRARAR